MTEHDHAAGDDIELKSHKGTGKKIGVLIGLIVLIGGGVAGWYFMLEKPKQERLAKLEAHRAFWTEFSEYHATGYGASWKCIFGGTDESQVNSNLKLETLIETAIGQNEGMFGKLILACIDGNKEMLSGLGKEPPPGLVGVSKQVENVKAMDLLPEYEEKFKGFPETTEAMYASWKALGDYFSGADERRKWDKKLDDVSTDGWGTLYVKEQKNEKPVESDLKSAWRYYKFMTCSLGKDYSELGDVGSTSALEKEIGKIMVDGDCSTDEKAAAYYPKVEQCATQFLLSASPDLDDPQFKNAVQKSWFREMRSLAAIAGSWQDPETGADYTGCIRRSRTYTKATGIENLFKTIMAYTEARVSLAKAYQAEKAKYEKK